MKAEGLSLRRVDAGFKLEAVAEAKKGAICAWIFASRCFLFDDLRCAPSPVDLGGLFVLLVSALWFIGVC